MCDSNGKHKKNLWGLVFDNKHCGNYINHLDLKGFTNIYIT